MIEVCFYTQVGWFVGWAFTNKDRVALHVDHIRGLSDQSEECKDSKYRNASKPGLRSVN